MNGHFTCNKREKRLLTELSSTGGRKQQFETVIITNYRKNKIKPPTSISIELRLCACVGDYVMLNNENASDGNFNLDLIVYS